MLVLRTLGIVLCSVASVTAGEFTITTPDDTVEIALDGNHFATYAFNDDATRRPYLCNVTAPDGTPITRPYPPGPGDDHGTMHPGIWLAFGDIDGNDFWRNKAWVKHEAFTELPEVLGNVASFTTRNRYETEDGRTILFEVQTLAFTSVKDAVVLKSTSTFTPAAVPVTFGDQEEMGLGFRLAKNLTVDSDNGTILNDQGERNGDEVWGKTAKWCDYSGTLNGKTYGITLVPGRENFRPSWMHARDYGLLVANLFGRNAMTGGEKSVVEVTKEISLTIAFTLVVHWGDEFDPKAFAPR